MKWLFPAKTFLLGEYIALFNGPALILTTTPCFEISWPFNQKKLAFHRESPAGLWCVKSGITQKFQWHDPYHGQGGLGASSAQFIGAYYASCHITNSEPHTIELLNAYYQVAWSGQGHRPSGYDVLAQTLEGCVYIENSNQYQLYLWPFQDLAFILHHTGKKIATHNHLKRYLIPKQMNHLTDIVLSGKLAFDTGNGERLIDAVNDYHACLMDSNLVAPHSQIIIEWLQKQSEVLAVKGCGALGADVILSIVSRNNLTSFMDKLSLRKWNLLATHDSLYRKIKTF